MEFVQMKCPNCGADLEVENSIDSFYCKYCGTKILVEGQSKHVVNAKVKIRMMDKLGDMQKEYHRDRAEREERQRKDSNKAMLMAVAILAVLLLLMYLRTI
jgi:DNA-directed RNA polymerase subunit RPC12/RpoP